MALRKGFTFIEMVVTLIIVAVLAAVALPSFFSSIRQTKVQEVEHNLTAIVVGEQKYYEDYGKYCLNTGACTSFGTINSNLNLSLVSDSDVSNYKCVVSAVNSFKCSATLSVGQAYTITINASGTLTCSPSSAVCP